MSRHSIDLPPDLAAKVAARAAESGHPSIEAYLRSLVVADARDVGEDLGAPAHLTFDDEEQLEAMLLARVHDERPSIEATPQFWADLRRRPKAGRDEQGKP